MAQRFVILSGGKNLPSVVFTLTRFFDFARKLAPLRMTAQKYSQIVPSLTLGILMSTRLRFVFCFICSSAALA
jgi:hypothetical protein